VPVRGNFEAVFLGPLFRELEISGSLFFKVCLELGILFGGGHLLEFQAESRYSASIFTDARPSMALINPDQNNVNLGRFNAPNPPPPRASPLALSDF
jgi:hypothetical protein